MGSPGLAAVRGSQLPGTSPSKWGFELRPDCGLSVLQWLQETASFVASISKPTSGWKGSLWS